MQQLEKWNMELDNDNEGDLNQDNLFNSSVQNDEQNNFLFVADNNLH